MDILMKMIIAEEYINNTCVFDVNYNCKQSDNDHLFDSHCPQRFTSSCWRK
jgi:hypothetical protein